MSTRSSDVTDDSYKSDRNESTVPVVSDDAPIEQADNSSSRLDPDSDQMLERDDSDAIDESNIINDGQSRTRGATKPEGTYQEPEDEEGLSADDGTSSV